MSMLSPETMVGEINTNGSTTARGAASQRHTRCRWTVRAETTSGSSPSRRASSATTSQPARVVEA